MCLNIWTYTNEENRTKENIMPLQAITLSPYQAQAISSVRETNYDINRRTVNRRRRSREVTYPVPIAFRVLHWFFVGGVVSIIAMLMLGL